MNERIREHVKDYNRKKGFGATDRDVIDEIRYGKIIWAGNESEYRWWTTYFAVVEIDGLLIGFENAKTTGDDSPEEKGWKFDSDSICEVEEKEKIEKYYVPKSD